MIGVDAGYAQWLKSQALFDTTTDAALTARWGDRAIETEIVTSLALATGADAEGARQLDFLGAPAVIDVHEVTGLRRDLYAQCVTLQGRRLGYTAGVLCFVIGVDEVTDLRKTVLTVVRRL